MNNSLMKIKVNGKELIIGPAEVNITELLKINNVAKPELVSVQLNGNFIGRELFPTTIIKEADEVDFLYFMGGGQMEV